MEEKVGHLMKTKIEEEMVTKKERLNRDPIEGPKL